MLDDCKECGAPGLYHNATCSVSIRQRNTEIKTLKAENKALKKQVEKLRNALAPFACLGAKELRPGDTNRARRALQ